MEHVKYEVYNDKNEILYYEDSNSEKQLSSNNTNSNNLNSSSNNNNNNVYNNKNNFTSEASYIKLKIYYSFEDQEGKVLLDEDITPNN